MAATIRPEHLAFARAWARSGSVEVASAECGIDPEVGHILAGEPHVRAYVESIGRPTIAPDTLPTRDDVIRLVWVTARDASARCDARAVALLATLLDAMLPRDEAPGHVIASGDAARGVLGLRSRLDS
jgi:hypothetical protein